MIRKWLYESKYGFNAMSCPVGWFARVGFLVIFVSAFWCGSLQEDGNYNFIKGSALTVFALLATLLLLTPHFIQHGRDQMKKLEKETTSTRSTPTTNYDTQ